MTLFLHKPEQKHNNDLYWEFPNRLLNSLCCMIIRISNVRTATRLNGIENGARILISTSV